MNEALPIARIEVQGHRGARGLAPENTLAGFEIALECGVTSIETDVHLTQDDVPVLIHDPDLAGRRVRTLTLAQLRGYRVEGPKAPATPHADQFAKVHGIDPCGIPTLAEFFAFVAAHPRGGRLIFDLELKRVPFCPETIGDGFTGNGPALLERRVVEAIDQAGVLHRSRVRSFDHRSVAAIKQLAPTLPVGVLVHNAVPNHIGKFMEDAEAELYCPDYDFVDANVVAQVHAAGKRIIPYTVNDEAAWERLVAWGVDGVTTDYPDRLIGWLQRRGLAVL